MTPDDDAFIRTIVDSPGHDLPRLVYADWLDDRDDPRGPFLRAEVEWAQPWKDGQRPGDATELRAMAAGLDPLWVARVSRPPVGVCCDHLYFQHSGPQLSQKSVAEVDRWPGVKLPVEYKAFLWNHNGGIPIRQVELPRQNTTGLIRFAEFFPIIPPGDSTARGTLHGEAQFYWDHTLSEEAGITNESEEEERSLFSDVLPIGRFPDEGGGELRQLILLGVRRSLHPWVFGDVGQPMGRLTELLARICGQQD